MHVIAADVRDANEMIELLEMPPAVQVPFAERAEVDDVGEGLDSRGRLSSTESFVSQFDVAVVGLEIGDSERHALLRAEDDVHLFGADALDAREVLAVSRELQKSVGLW